MANKMQELPEAVIEHLTEDNIVIVATISKESEIKMELLSWVWPMNSSTVRFVISPNFPGGINLTANSQAVLQIIGHKMSFEIRGTTRLVKENCDSVKFPETMYDLIIEEVRENMFPATHLTGSIPYARDEGTQALHKELDDAMYAEIKSTPVGTPR